MWSTHNRAAFALLWILLACVIGTKSDLDLGLSTDVYSEDEETTQDGDEATEAELEEDEDEYTNLLHSVKLAKETEDDYAANRALLDSLPSEYEVVYPVQVRRNEILPLDTRDSKAKVPGSHYAHTTILLKLHGRKVRLRLSLNKDLMKRGMRLKRSIPSLSSHTQLIEESLAENCYYQGQVKRRPDTFVAVNTCDGISGWLLLSNISYVIRPLQASLDTNETRRPHVVFRPVDRPHMKCANDRGIWQSFRALHAGEYIRRTKIMRATQGEYDTLDAAKHAEIAVVADHSLFVKLNRSVDAAVEFLLQTTNIMDSHLRGLNLSLSLSFVEVWNHQDLFPVSTNPRAALHSFLKYRSDTLTRYKLDMALLLTGQEFTEAEAGMAVPDSMCSDRAVAVAQVGGVGTPLQASSVAVHMVAHMLGIHHQPSDCGCASTDACIMSHTDGGVGAAGHLLSDCSVAQFKEVILAGLGSCLLKNPPKASFQQLCGNGKLERGEECDCLSPQECAITDPCCDPNTCLLRPWSTCRHGDCCHNCTLRPPTHLCRSPQTECDVPEYCDGEKGQCPSNALIQDGWPCRDEESYCYRGMCHTYIDQCQFIWGAGSRSGAPKCYNTFNKAGNFNGHCGHNRTADNFRSCADSDVMCGLLHCTGGDSSPRIGKERTFLHTHIVAAGVDYQCKIISTPGSEYLPDFGMVRDGTRCRAGHMCLGARCVAMETLGVTPCPVGEAGLACSGRGICTSESQCFCHMNYTGEACAETHNLTLLYAHYTVPVAPATTKAPPIVQEGPLPTTEYIHSTTPPPIIKEIQKQGGVTTLWLVIVLASVAGGALIILACFMICYRRKSSMLAKKKKKKKKHKPSIFGSLTSFSSSNSKTSGHEGSVEVKQDRLISFGNMPSYRADKIKKVMRKSVGEHSETGSEVSRGDRSSGEVRVPHTLPLARPPDKGILKKGPRSADDLLDLQQQASLSDPDSEPQETDPLRPHMSPMCWQDVERGYGLQGSTDYEGGPPPPFQDLDDHDPGQYAPLQRGSDVEFVDKEDDDYEVLSQCDCDEKCDCESCCSSIDKKSFSDFEVDYDDDDRSPVEACDQETQTELDASSALSGATGSDFPRSASGDSIEGAKNKIIKLKNINELLKQIDEQFNSVLKQTSDMSPSCSDEFQGSEVEADRCFPRNSFYRQSDVETGFSPPSRSPVLSPNPSTQRSSTRYSSALSSDNDPLHSPSGISPISAITSSTLAPTPQPLPSRIGGHHNFSPSRYSTPKVPNGGAVPKVPTPTSAPREGSPTRHRQMSPSRIPVAQLRSNHQSQGQETQTSPPQEMYPPQISPRGDNQIPVSSPHPHQMSPATQTVSPSHHRNFGSECPPAIPYRGAAGGSPASSLPGSPPLVRHKTKGSSNPASKHSTLESNDSANHRDSSPSPRASREESSPRPNKITHPLLDGYPFKKRGSVSQDVHSTSEGYHSDSRVEADESAVIKIVREIPGKKPVDLPFLPNPNGAYTRAPGSPGSPEDVNV